MRSKWRLFALPPFFSTHPEEEVGLCCDDFNPSISETRARTIFSYVLAFGLRWGPGAVSGVVYAVGVFEIDAGRARLCTRHPFTAVTDKSHQRVVLSTPLRVRAGHYLGILNLDDDFTAVAYYRPRATDDDQDRPPPSLFGVDCYSARAFLQGAAVEVIPASATLRINWELQSEVPADTVPTVGGGGKEPRVCWTVGPEWDLHRCSGQLGAAVGISTPGVSEGGRCVGLDVVFGTIHADAFAVGVFECDE